MLVLTATASTPVRLDIVDALCICDPRILVTGRDPPEPDLIVRRFVEEDAKRRGVVRRLSDTTGIGIVYAGRRRVEELVEAIEADGIADVAGYHADLAKARREEIHESFRDGSARILVVTTAFGMGHLQALRAFRLALRRGRLLLQELGGRGGTGTLLTRRCSGGSKTWACAGSSRPVEDPTRCPSTASSISHALT